jgi:uncharacterized protein YecE (DUF72 family)
MEFGKADPSQLASIDFRLPDDDPRTWDSFVQAKKHLRGLPRFGVGAPVWGVKDWIGKVYPAGTPAKDFLFHYSRQFNTIELNTTHYRTPDVETVARWREQTPDTFRFCVKFLQEISHRHPLSGRSPLLNEFVSAIMGLEDRLGISFLQLPPNFEPRDLGELRKFLEQLPKGFKIAIEVRHPSFFKDHKLNEAYFDLLSEFHAHAVITDVAGRRDVLHLSLPTSKVLLRFIGNDLHDTDYTRIRDWVERLRTWVSLGLTDVEFFVHQPEDRNAPDLITFLIDEINTSRIASADGTSVLQLQKWQPMNQGEQLGFF